MTKIADSGQSQNKILAECEDVSRRECRMVRGEGGKKGKRKTRPASARDRICVLPLPTDGGGAEELYMS